MDPMNYTLIKEFILTGFSQNMTICVLFFSALLLFYMITIVGNVFVIITVILSATLHQPMYFFLCKLSFLDVCYSSNTLPKAMVDIFSRRRTISVSGCLVQMSMSTLLGSTESFLLAVMAYDRFVAICYPLSYNVLLNWQVCRNMVFFIWLASFFISVVPFYVRPLIFCAENKLDHFVCEILAVLELTCSNLNFYKVTILVATFFTLVVPLIFIVVSYIFILSVVLKIQSNEGRSKAFSTCASHMTIVSMYYGTVLTMYMGQNINFASNLKYISLVYGVMTPVLNPLIYSIRSNDVKNAFAKIWTKYFVQRNMTHGSY